MTTKYENSALTSLKAQRAGYLVQRHELDTEIKEKQAIMELVDEKIDQLRHAINGAGLAQQAFDLDSAPTPQ